MHIEKTGLLHFDDFRQKAQEILLEKGGTGLFVVTLNVNNFKFVNQTYGYKKGDYLLKHIANFFCYEEPLCLIACREYSDHFIILGEMNGMTKEELTDYMSQRIEDFSKTIVKNFPFFRIHLNMGGFIIEKEIKDVSEAFDNAELARRSIKGSYMISMQLYDEQLQKKAVEEATMIPLFNQAISEGWIFAYLQPKIEIATGKIVGAEALVRMVDANGNMVSPAAFVPKLEEGGIIYECDLFVLEQVLITIKRWLAEGKTPVPVSVNLSRMDFYVSGIEEKIENLLKKYQVPLQYIELEVTETAFVDDLDQVINLVAKLQDFGLKISVDDFGSGYSSLSTVGIIPVDVIKLDRSFVQNCIHTQRGCSVVKKIVEMFEELKLEVICEGVETKEEEEILEKCGVKYVQGYLHDRPLKISDFEQKYIYVS